jgi:hypothetical protein
VLVELEQQAIWQHEIRKTERSVTGGNFAKQVAEAAQATAILHGTKEGSGYIRIFSGAEIVSGTSVSVFMPYVAVCCLTCASVLMLFFIRRLWRQRYGHRHEISLDRLYKTKKNKAVVGQGIYI